MSGKWDMAGVPHKGWTCVDVEDLEEPAAICEMCEVQEIRYVHYMEHADYPGGLAVGCICAGHMEQDYEAPRRRERVLQNRAGRRSRWLRCSWKMSRKGNAYINVEGFNIIVFCRTDGSWGGRIEDQLTAESVMSRRRYANEDQAKLAAFDAMVFLKEKKGWGQCP